MDATHRELLVRDLMTSRVFALTAGQSLTLAETAMRSQRIRHIPVIDGERRLLGLVTHRDLLAAKVSRVLPMDKEDRSEFEFAIPVSSLMQKTVWSVSPTTPALNAARLLRDHKFGCLPVLEDGRLVGIVTEADFLRLVLDSLDLGEPPPRLTLGDAMTRPAESLPLTATLHEARAAMTAGAVRHLPIVDEQGRPLGMISDRDLRVAEAIAGTESSITVGFLGTESPVSRHVMTALGPVLLDMAAQRIGSVLVVDDDTRLVGILTSTDACRMLGERFLDLRPARP
ncbi:MAG: CBS domain-containing protein [Myxococcota bacterium]